MITIYSTDAEGRLFTDPQQRFFIDAELLQEKKTALRIQALLDQIAVRVGYKSGDELTTSLTCFGYEVDKLIRSGNLAQVLAKI